MRTLALLVLSVALAGCATNPVSGSPDFVLLSENQEIELGRANDPKIRAQFGLYDDPELQAYVQRVGERLAAQSHRPDLIYRFAVLDSPDVNAFALPGGYIYITRGILAYLQSEAELAAVLGHEIGHVTARHSVKQYSAATAASVAAAIFLRTQAGQDLFNIIGNALISGYGREHELESDRLGAEYLARSGYNPNAMIEVVGVLKNQEEFEKERAKAEGREPRIYHGVFATHPSADTRLQEVVAEARRHAVTDQPRLGRDEYLKHLDGLVFGDSAKSGVRHGASFYHREMNFAVTFPEGWRVENSPSAVTAFDAGRDAVVQMRAEDLNKRGTPRDYMKTRLKLDDMKDEKPVPGIGLPSHSGIARLSTPFGRRDARVAVVFQGNRAFTFFGASKKDLSAHDPVILAVAASLHPLTAEEQRIAEGLRIRVVTAGPRDTFAGLAKRSPVTNYAESVLRLINDRFPDGEPRKGELVKIIE
ncbi:peptidase M48 [Sulfurifustis variabilis]|uniref:Peptidase M48 n=1 Tax=Sulfurifustis variabilis TaxID=1675686 RepID=A0A1B4VC21_9GAMM|nr:M48 family metalloprotease [Sulfurifustis variabilis]BAU50384.1 peptidase M48 [Sulfurifustis variabilis]